MKNAVALVVCVGVLSTGQLSRARNRVVVDRTGLPGNYDIDLVWTPPLMRWTPSAGPPPGNGASLETAVLEQLGTARVLTMLKCPRDRALWVILGCVLVVQPLVAQDATSVDAVVKKAGGAQGFMGAVLVARDGTIVINRAYGFANLEWQIPSTV